MAGLHFILDGFKATKPELLKDKDKLRKWMNNLPAKIGMRILLPTMVVEIGQPNVEPGWEGITGFTLIYESHISVHTFPALKKVHVDVFSCKAFDATKVLCEFINAFGLKEWEQRIIERNIG